MISKELVDDLRVAKETTTKNPPKRYIPFLMDEWREKIEKPLGASVSADDAKEIITNLLAKLASGEWVIDKHPKK